MSRFASLSRRLAIEDAELDMGEVEMVPAPEAEAPAAVAEVVEAGQDIDDGLGAINEASDDVAELETVGEIVSDSVEPEVEGGAEGPGMEPVAAALAAETVRRLRKKWGLSSPQAIGAPSLESFGRASSRKQATRLALLGISDTIKKIWEKIKAFFKGLWDKIKSAIKSIFQSNVKTQQRAIALRKEVTALTQTKGKNDSFESGSLAKAFGVKDKDVEQKNVIACLTNHATVIKATVEVNNGTAEFIKSIKNSVTFAAAPSGNVDWASIADNTKQAVQKLAGNFKDITAESTNDSGHGLNTVRSELRKKTENTANRDGDPTIEVSGPFVGSTYMYMMTQPTKDTANKIEGILTYFGTETIAQNTNNSVKTAKSKEEMNAVINAVIAGCEAMGQAERAVKVGDTTAKEVNDLSTLIISKSADLADEKTDGATASNLKKHIHATQGYVNMVTQITGTMNGSMMTKNMSAMNYALDWVSGSIKQFKANTN
jgi:hypothetical protein